MFCFLDDWLVANYFNNRLQISNKLKDQHFLLKILPRVDAVSRQNLSQTSKPLLIMI
jgi:hypothetical protein